MPLVQNGLVTMMREAAGGDDWPWQAALLREGADKIDQMQAALCLIADMESSARPDHMGSIAAIDAERRAFNSNKR